MPAAAPVADHLRWDHDIAYHPVVLAAVPRPCARALDVGCGEGQLTRALRSRVDHVVGLDRDEAGVAAARAQGGRGTDHVVGDLLDPPFAPGTFDLVTSMATLHHVDARAGLTAMAALVRPGGVLVVVGLARSRLPHDVLWEGAGVVAHQLHRLRTPVWEHPSPRVWPPPETHAGMRALATGLLPGLRWRRHLLWRWSLVWRKPAHPVPGPR
ncbi:class I SAM-dependent methyltransferase [Modestobacter sp. VKM Ac-2986]|uniref:class I SAM-dependent methyltransferase n=1 Tax=Modestobacter sp. VKM Ac-2986 TaxID=3004140 RepID=UPI0022AAFFDD|nr:class I SAM-dependent methyltransferase [Modestobacter sp. VKM Ac-2986]MCZ2828052.1 class I SAM-dependent methyltransferase [Modestobacter sp. VKM Ac-2986]